MGAPFYPEGTGTKSIKRNRGMKLHQNKAWTNCILTFPI
jgi:hypothetical protein